MGRHFTEEFKRETVRLASTRGKSRAELGHELGIRPDIIRKWQRWVKAQESPVASSAPSPAPEAVDAELRRLRREVAVLREEREILKKATAFFAKESR